MTEKRFYLNEGEVGILNILDLKEDSENFYLTSSKSDMERVVELLNESHKKNKDLKQMVDFYKDFQKDARELEEENEQLKKENEELKQSKKDKNCHNCKNCEAYDEGEYGFDFLCKKDCMNNDGYFDYEYHGFKQLCICPFWEEDEYD